MKKYKKRKEEGATKEELEKEFKFFD